MPNITEFINTANIQITGQGTTAEALTYRKQNEIEFDTLEVSISFGIGRATNIPWIAFLGYNQKVQQGFYPVLLYYKEFNLLFLAYGVSENNEPIDKWPNSQTFKTIRDYLKEKGIKHPNSYGNSFVFKVYNLEQGINEVEIQTDILNLTSFYHTCFNMITNSKEVKIINSNVTEPITKMKVRVINKLTQAICVIGDSGVGKTYRIVKTLEKENHKKLFVIIDSMWQHLLFDYSPNDRKYNLTKIGEFIKRAQDDLENNYTIVIDECHKNLEIINDVLLQAISTKRNEGVRFLSINSVVDHQFNFLPESDGNRILPSNLGFIFISSKSDLIEGNDDLKNRIEIIQLNETDQNDKDYSIEYLFKKVKEIEDSEYTN
jgi:hypothetical protein